MATLLRGPHDVTSSDDNACELMCAGQLLYMAGLLDDASSATLNAMVGRRSGQLDLAGCASRLLFGEGFEKINTIPADYDLASMVANYETWREDQHRHYGVDCADDASLRDIWNMWRQYGQNMLDMYAQYTDQLIELRQDNISAEDIQRLVDDDYVLFVSLHSRSSTGYTIIGMVYGRLDDETYEAYDPEYGLRSLTVADILADNSSLTGWRLRR